MTTDAASRTVVAGPPDSAAPGGFERLRAFDGLFLRAEHLRQAQDYGRDLAMAVGQAGGPGTVFGYDAVIEGASLVVSPGLAVSADGRPLRSTERLRFDLGGLQADTTSYHLVLLRCHSWDGDPEPVQGLICDEPCSGTGGSTQASTSTEGVWLDVRRVPVDGMPREQHVRRSWLAASVFAQEGSDAHGWPESSTSTVPSSWDSRELPKEPDDAVPLAVLFRGGTPETWLVDAWIARRDRGEPPPAQDWQWRLGMRPWQVFVAQVLQFQTHLAGLTGSDDGQPGPVPAEELRTRLDQLRTGIDAAATRTARAKLSNQLGDLLAELGSAPRDAGRSSLVKPVAGAAAPGTTADTTLLDRGFVDVPPAGFLPTTADDVEGAADRASLLLGAGLVRRVCTLSVGDVGEVFSAARSRPRTPLDAVSVKKGGPVLDLHVPIGRDGRAVGRWVLFTRSPDIVCTNDQTGSAEYDDVTVHVTTPTPSGDGAVTKTLGILHYPPASWAVPSEEPPDSVYAEVQAVLDDDATGIEAVVRSEERRPLGALRAMLLATAYGSGKPLTPAAVATSVGKTESITVVVSKGESDSTRRRTKA